jgi:hypothetical protein
MTSKINNWLAFPEELDLSEVCTMGNPEDSSLTVVCFTVGCDSHGRVRRWSLLFLCAPGYSKG